MLRIFNTITIPVALYNSEVWGPMFFSSNPGNTQLFGDNTGVSVNNIQYMFLRVILGVTKNSSKLAILIETGQLPLITNVITSIVKFWFHLSNSNSPILRNSLRVNAELHNKGCKTWYTTVKKIVDLLNIEHILYTADTRELAFQHNQIKYTVRAKFQEYWKQELNSRREGKLEFYSQYVSQFCLQDYFNCNSLPQHLRKVITRFRIGAHKLPAETGRYFSNISRDERYCPLCCNGIGNEKHYLILCDNPIILSLRNYFFSKIGFSDTVFSSLGSEERIAHLMSSNDHNTLINLGFFLEKLEAIFKERKPQV